MDTAVARKRPSKNPAVEDIESDICIDVGVSGLSGRYVEELKDVWFRLGTGATSTLTVPDAALSSDGGSTYGWVDLCLLFLFL